MMVEVGGLGLEDTSCSKSGSDMRDRYMRAQYIMQGIFTKNITLNTTLIPHWISGSECFWYERELKEGKEFRLVDADACSNGRAFDHEKLAQLLSVSSGRMINQNDLPIQNISMSMSPLVIRFESFDKRWVYNEVANTCEELGHAQDALLLSPDGKNAVFKRNHNLWVKDVATGEESPLTDDGEKFYPYAEAPSSWGVNVSPPGVEAIWSPDSKYLFTLQLDSRAVKTLPMIQHVPNDGSVRPQLVGLERRFAIAGDKHIDEYRFLMINMETGEIQDAQYPRCPVFRNAVGFFTFGHGWWNEDSGKAYFIDLERGGDHYARLVEIDAKNGEARILFEESSPDSCFKLRLDSRVPIHARPLRGSDDMIWYSERSGWGHLYLYNLRTGELKHPVTKGEWVVRDIHHYDEEARELVIQTSGRSSEHHAYYRDVCRVNVDTGELKQVLSTDHETIIFDEKSELAANLSSCRDVKGAAGVSDSGKHMVVTRSRANATPVSLLIDQEGNEKLLLERADISGLPSGWQWPEPVKLLSADGKTDIYGVVYRPSDFSPEKSYPILDVSLTLKEGYFLSAGSFTNNSVAGLLYYSAAALAELGFIVVEISGRGTTSRSRAFYNADLDPKLPNTNNEADRVAGITQLAQRYSYMDLDRVGLTATDGVAVSIYDVLKHPEFYKVAVLHCSHDPRFTFAAIGEQHEGIPIEKGSKPKTDYAENRVELLKGKLLLIEGMLDFATPSTTFRLVDALHKANKDFDMLCLPNMIHDMSTYSIRRSWDYLVTHLLDVDPPTEFNLTSGIDLQRESLTE